MDMTKLKWKALCLIAVCLSACQTGYQRAGTYGGIPFGGYSDERIDQNTVIVKYNGNSFTKRREVSAYLLLRSAEVTVENGYDYFIISSMTSSPIDLDILTKQSYNGYVTSPPKAYPSYYRSITYKSYRYRMSPFEATMQGCPNYDPRGESAVIKMFEGVVPPNTPFAYDAKNVIAHLSPLA